MNCNQFNYWYNTEINLPMYYDKFIDNGFDDMRVMNYKIFTNALLKKLSVDQHSHRYTILNAISNYPKWTQVCLFGLVSF